MNKQTVLKQILDKIPDRFEKSVKKAFDFAIKHSKLKNIWDQQSIIYSTIKATELNLDTNSIISVIMYSTFPLEATELDDKILSTFGDDIFHLLTSLRASDKIVSNNLSRPKVLLRYLLGINSDLRIVMIRLCCVAGKLAQYHKSSNDIPNKQVNSVLTVYGAIASYLNLPEFKKEIEESAFKLISPIDYKKIKRILSEASINTTLLKQYKAEMYKDLSSLKFSPQIFGRIKNIYSIYQKIRKFEKEKASSSTENIRDFIAFTIILNTIDDCFKVIDLMEFDWDIDFNSIDDYITHPKRNGFQALQFHATNHAISTNTIEIQVITKEMYYTNTYGPASHLAYKMSGKRHNAPAVEYDWIESVHNSIKEHINKREARRSIPITASAFPKILFAITPKGKIIELRKNNTALDFAYKIHSDIGRGALAAKVNGISKKLKQTLKNGDTVEIIRNKAKKYPDSKHLSYVNSTFAKNKIRKALQEKNKMSI